MGASRVLFFPHWPDINAEAAYHHRGTAGRLACSLPAALCGVEPHAGASTPLPAPRPRHTGQDALTPPLRLCNQHSRQSTFLLTHTPTYHHAYLLRDRQEGKSDMRGIAYPAVWPRGSDRLTLLPMLHPIRWPFLPKPLCPSPLPHLVVRRRDHQ